jgi:hypothetical protein
MNFDNLNTKIQQLDLSEINGGANYISKLHVGGNDVDMLYKKILGGENEIVPDTATDDGISDLFININNGGGLFVDIKKVSLRDTLNKF